jgi:MFS family permease
LNDQSGPDWRQQAPGAWLTVGVLSAAYMMSIVDRQIPALLVDSIRADLRLTDTEVSLITGLAFALLYTTAAVPLARMGDLSSRRGVIAAGIALWGLMTSVCGAAQTFWQFFLGRLGVGLGEAALTPNAYAIIADRFAPEKRAKAMGVFVIGASTGYGVALLIGAAAIAIAGAAQNALTPVGIPLAPWRVVLIGLGVLTIALCGLVVLFVRDPVRRPDAGQPAAFRAVLADLYREWRGFAPLFLGVPLMNLAMYGFAAWSPAIIMRGFGWSETNTGLWLGASQVAAGIVGVFAFAWAADRSRVRGREEGVIDLISLGALGSALAMFLLPFAGNVFASLALMAVVGVLTGGVSTLAPVALQTLVASDRRGQVSSLFLLVANLLGIGFGATSVALVTDFVFGDASAVDEAVALVCSSALVVGAAVAVAFRARYCDLARRMEPPS